MRKKSIREPPLSEICLRKYERPFGLRNRELIKKLCLSVGLLQPGDSRDVIVDILYAIILSKEGLKPIIIEQNIRQLREQAALSLEGITSPNVRRQLRRLKLLFLIEKKNGVYRICEGSLENAFTEKLEKFYIPSIIDRVKQYLKAVDALRE